MAYVMLEKKQDRGGGEMIRGKWKWLLILLAALAVLVGLMALETLLGSVLQVAEPRRPYLQRRDFMTRSVKRVVLVLLAAAVLAFAAWMLWPRSSGGCVGLTSLLPLWLQSWRCGQMQAGL